MITIVRTATRNWWNWNGGAARYRFYAIAQSPPLKCSRKSIELCVNELTFFVALVATAMILQKVLAMAVSLVFIRARLAVSLRLKVAFRHASEIVASLFFGDLVVEMIFHNRTRFSWPMILILWTKHHIVIDLGTCNKRGNVAQQKHHVEKKSLWDGHLWFGSSLVIYWIWKGAVGPLESMSINTQTWLMTGFYLDWKEKK